MQIGEIAEATGLSRDTLRFYEKRGLLRARRSANGYRDYPAEAWTCCATSGWRRRWASRSPRSKPTCRCWREPTPKSPRRSCAALERKLADIDQRINGLQMLRGELTRRLGEDILACPLQGNYLILSQASSSGWKTASSSTRRPPRSAP
jgi:hypothetical protein